jgi:hypothetical protein
MVGITMLMLGACEGDDQPSAGVAGSGMNGGGGAGATGTGGGVTGGGGGVPTEWQPYLHDENFDRPNHQITGFPAIISYADAAFAEYPVHIGAIGPNDEPVGTCELRANELLGVAPALRCTFGETYETSADPAMGGDPYGYGQTYLGPGGVELAPELGNVTALSITFVWQLGEGWLDAMEQRNDRRFETLWDAPYADVEIGGAGAKPLIAHRENCEYWYDVSAQLGTGPTTVLSGSLDAPDGVVADSLEIVGAGGEFVTEQGGVLQSSVDGSTVGSLDLNTGAYTVSLVNAVPASSPVNAYFRSRPPGDDPSNPRHQSNGIWRLRLGDNSCRERPMMLARNLAEWTTSDDTLPSMTLSMGDDIACYCWDYHDDACHEAADHPDEGSYAQFRIGSPVHDDPANGVYHVGVAEPLFVEFLVDTTNDVLELRVTTPDGRFDDTVVSRTTFCDSGNAAATRPNDHPHRFGNIFHFGEPFWTLPLTTVPSDCWHQVGQWRITGATDGAALTPQGPPAGFVRR